jgi:hypothetical protein
MDERELSLKIRDYLNRTSLGYNFKFIDSFCDIADEKNRIYIEVKPDHFAHAQLLHGIAKAGIRKAKFLGVADSREVKLYSPIPFQNILNFATSFDPKLVFSPSQADKPELNSLAEKLLGDPKKIIKFDFQPSKFLYITKDNMKSVREVTDKYRIQLDLLVHWLDGAGETDCIKVNDHGWLVNIERADMFTNEAPSEKSRKELTEFGSGGFRRPKHKPIQQSDAPWFESLRVKHEELADILHEVDRLLSRKKRRERGVFWTEAEIGDMLADEIMELTKPDFVVEPCVGGGSLVKKIVPRVNGTMNDISVSHVNNCKKIFDGYNWNFTTFDVVNTDTDDLIKGWKIPAGRILLLYTNPPFGTVSTNILASKKSELVNGNVSRKQKIVVPTTLLKYGRGDLFLPIVGRLIEIAREHKNCYLAFFSPFGLFCGRKRYMNLFRALMKDFAFLKGYVFAGYNFHDINKTLPIALSIWKYKPNTLTKHNDLSFDFVDKNAEKKTLRFKELPLLKDGWRYGDGSRNVKQKTKDAIGAPRCERFNAPQPKITGVDLKEGSGAEISPDNLRLDKGVIVDIPNVPSELVYGLWSVTVGKHAFGTSLSVSLHPIYFEQCYVHLPDFTKKETLEILAYSALGVLLKNYAEDRIGFFGANRVFRFGNERLTKGVEYLFKLCTDSPVYDNLTVGDIFELLRQSKVDKTKLRKGLIEAVTSRLSKIGYWDYIPIPTFAEDDETKQEGEL